MKNFFYLFVVLVCISRANAAGQWTDLTDGVSTYDGSTEIALVDRHTYRPTSGNAFTATSMRLPASATVTVGACAVSGFNGNTYSAFTAEGVGNLTLYGCDGTPEVFTSLVKSTKGALIINDRTSGGLTISSFTAAGDALVGDITINTFGAGTVLNFADNMKPVGAAQPFTLNLDPAAIVTLTTLTSVPKLTGTGRLTLGNTLAAITAAEVLRIAGFKGLLTTRAGGTTSITFTADEYTWTLTETEVDYSVIKAMKGTVRLPASTVVNFGL